jgi:hypothetical protein
VKRIAIAVCLALGACAAPDYSRTDWPQPTGGPSSQRADYPDIVTRAPNARHERTERASAAEECAQYGRVARRRGGRDYECVAPGEAARSDPDWH